MSMKNPLTPAGIEPATFRFVAEHLNDRATAVPLRYLVSRIFENKNQDFKKKLRNTNKNEMENKMEGNTQC